MRKAIVIGLDGATFDLLTPLLEKGYLPNIKDLMDRGVWGRLRTVIPPGTGPAWSSIVTGLDPSNHGIFDLIVRAENSYKLAFLNSSSLRAPTVWDVVGGAGGKVAVLNVPMTFPPRKVNGYLVSGLLTPLGTRECTYPADLFDTIMAAEPSYKVVPTETYRPGGTETYLGEINRVFDSKVKVLKYLLPKLDWKFGMQVFNETDFLQHALWHVIDPAHPYHNKAEHEKYAEQIFGFYRRIDGLIGELAASLGDEASIFIISDHGHGPLHEFIHVNNFLLKRGVMKVRRSLRSRVKYMLFKAGFTPLSTYRIANALGLGRVRMGLRWTSKGYGLLSKLFFSFSDIDWGRSLAYAISGGVYGGVFINLKGREPSGVVRDADYEQTRELLGRALLELRHPLSGERIIREVIKREDIYKGKFIGEAPDLYFLPQEPTMAVFGDFEFSSNRVVEPASQGISAQHRMEGIMIAKGPGIAQGMRIENISVLDIAPLLYYVMDLPIPEGLDGEFRRDIFTGQELDHRPPKYINIEDLFEAARAGRQSTEDQSIKERLKGLGYIS
jgi:predicted AlkP superfamily phosphohydrolase/phosphomutase